MTPTPWQERVQPTDSPDDIENHMLDEIAELRELVGGAK